MSKHANKHPIYNSKEDANWEGPLWQGSSYTVANISGSYFRQ